LINFDRLKIVSAENPGNGPRDTKYYELPSKNTMLKILKKLALSNVVSFNLSDNEPILAAYASGLHAKTSRKMQDIKKTPRLEKANRYLAKQFKRLERLSSTDPIGFDYLSLKLMQKSVYTECMQLVKYAQSG
jgi:hypothetical protein